MKSNYLGYDTGIDISIFSRYYLYVYRYYHSSIDILSLNRVYGVNLVNYGLSAACSCANCALVHISGII